LFRTAEVRDIQNIVIRETGFDNVEKQPSRLLDRFLVDFLYPLFDCPHADPPVAVATERMRGQRDRRKQASYLPHATGAIRLAPSRGRHKTTAKHYRASISKSAWRLYNAVPDRVVALDLAGEAQKEMVREVVNGSNHR
jgi:hypothetical protein